MDKMTDDIKIVKEGLAEAFYPDSVFYNPVQEFNRDLTIAVLNQFAQEYLLNKPISQSNKRTKEDKVKEKQMPTNDMRNELEKEKEKEKEKEGPTRFEDISDAQINRKVLQRGIKCDNGLRILEALSASGLRSMRFAKEVGGINEIITNDFSKDAYEMIKKNAAHNNVEDLIVPSLADATMVMYQNRRYSDRFHIIDLDPYGSAVQFLDGAVQAVRDGGLLCVTCTDTAVLCGNSSETCYSKYGAMSLKGKFCHEMALRILLQSIESHANRYSRYIVPLMSMSADFYIRVFVKVHTGQGIVKQSVSKLSMVYHCSGCGVFEFQKLGTCTPTKGRNFKYGTAVGPPVQEKCQHCHSKHHIGGPIWTAPIHDRDFIQTVVSGVQEDSSKFGTSQRIVGMLSLMLEELQDCPLYYIIDHLVNVVHCIAPNMLQIRSAIMNAGYRVSLSHAAKNSIKTDAPPNIIWDIMRSWVKTHPISEKRKQHETPGKHILSKEPTTDVSFDLRADANPKSREKGLVRFQQNPESFWGPKPRAKKGSGNEDSKQMAKSVKLQGKKRKVMEESQDFKQFKCKKFRQGKCDLGNNCKYSHNLEIEITQTDHDNGN